MVCIIDYMGLRVSGNYSALPLGVKAATDCVNDEYGCIAIKLIYQTGQQRAVLGLVC